MIERAYVDLKTVPQVDKHVVHFTAADDPQWAGVCFLGAGVTLPTSPASDHDLYVIAGSLREALAEHRAGDFLRRRSPFGMTAGAEGATVFVYRQQARKGLTLQTGPQDALQWFSGGASGMTVARLSDTPHPVSLVSWQPGAAIRQHAHPRGEEIFVLNGVLCDEQGAHRAGSWLRFHPGAKHAPYALQTTLILLRNGHLSPLASANQANSDGIPNETRHAEYQNH